MSCVAAGWRALAMRFRETRLPPDPDCAACAPGRTTVAADAAAVCRSG